MAANTDLLRERQETWASFVKLTVVSTVGIVIVLGLMAIFLL
jgi:hypothetical protein